MDYHNNTDIKPGIHIDTRDESIWVVESIEDFGNPHYLLFNLALKTGMVLSKKDQADWYETVEGVKTITGQRLIAINIRDLDGVIRKTVKYSTFKKFFKQDQ